MDLTRSHTRVFITDLLVPVRIGLLDWEKAGGRTSPLSVSVELFTSRADWKGAGAHDILNYGFVHDYLQGWRTREHTELLETLADELIETCLADPRVEACRVKLVKPQIFADAAGAGVEIYRTR